MVDKLLLVFENRWLVPPDCVNTPLSHHEEDTPLVLITGARRPGLSLVRARLRVGFNALFFGVPPNSLPSKAAARNC